jgi:glucosamine-6-phosphate deaminase
LESALVLTEKDIKELSRPGFEIKFYDDVKSFFIAEAMEYVNCWKQSIIENPKGICGPRPIGPVEHIPLVAQIINDMEIKIRDGYFWAIDEWYLDGKEIPLSNSLSFTQTNLDLCFNKIRKDLECLMKI